VKVGNAKRTAARAMITGRSENRSRDTGLPHGGTCGQGFLFVRLRA
jgi:hypothetical protein